jgi:hypothetical protein
VGSCQIATIAVPPRVMAAALAVAGAEPDALGVPCGEAHAVATKAAPKTSVNRRFM